MKKFTCSYSFDGGQYVVQFPATDFDEARRRLRAIGTTGQVDGELTATIPANAVTAFPLSFLLPLVCAVRNMLVRAFGGRA